MLKYRDLTLEIKLMWKVKVKVIPVITGASGTVSVSFRRYMRNIAARNAIKELQKAAILGTAHILRKVIM